MTISVPENCKCAKPSALLEELSMIDLAELTTSFGISILSLLIPAS
jgi:hypothetical protein